MRRREDAGPANIGIAVGIAQIGRLPLSRRTPAYDLNVNFIPDEATITWNKADAERFKSGAASGFFVSCPRSGHLGACLWSRGTPLSWRAVGDCNQSPRPFFIHELKLTMKQLFHRKLASLCLLLVSTSAVVTSRADTILFDNSASPIVSSSFISAWVSQVVRFKTDSFAVPTQLDYADLWVTQFVVNDGIMPNVVIYEDNAGALGNLLDSAALTSSVPNTYIPQPVRVEFGKDQTLAPDSYYWFGMNFAPGATGSLGMSTSMQDETTTVAFLTSFGLNYVPTFNMPNVKIVGTPAAVPDSAATGALVALGLIPLALFRRRLTRTA